jgi:hypothetical protein
VCQALALIAAHAYHQRNRVQQKERRMSSIDQVKEHMEVIGADGVHVGTVDAIEGHRIKLTKADSGQGSHEGHHHYVSTGLIAGVEGDQVRLSANAAVAVQFAEEEDEAQGG